MVNYKIHNQSKLYFNFIIKVIHTRLNAINMDDNLTKEIQLIIKKIL